MVTKLNVAVDKNVVLEINVVPVEMASEEPIPVMLETTSPCITVYEDGYVFVWENVTTPTPTAGETAIPVPATACCTWIVIADAGAESASSKASTAVRITGCCTR